MRQKKPVGCASPMINGKTLNDTISTSVSSLSTDIRIGLVPVSGNKQEIIPCEGYEIVAKFNKYYLVKSKARYPKTYIECCEKLGVLEMFSSVTGYKADEIESLQQLIICLDVYWNIAGEEFGLDKQWKPDWKDTDSYYTISYKGLQNVKLHNDTDVYALLSFPSEEMRDAFYENFKELIENCKDLL